MSNLGFAGHTGSKQLLNSAAVVWKPQTTCKWRSMAGDRTDLAPDHSSANPCSKSSQLRKPLLSYDLKVYWEGYEPESDFLGLKSPLSSSPSQWHSGTWSSESLYCLSSHTDTYPLYFSSCSISVKCISSYPVAPRWVWLSFILPFSSAHLC